MNIHVVSSAVVFPNSECLRLTPVNEFALTGSIFVLIYEFLVLLLFLFSCLVLLFLLLELNLPTVNLIASAAGFVRR